jgi:hypothetical protein
MAENRSMLSKRIRFEVFKRDSFKCQYCGGGAPEVLLHVDHIKPVAGGGDDDLTNLITSCQPCNLGKGARELSDDSTIQKQRVQLEELNERRQQLEMMLEWKTGLSGIEADAAKAVEKRCLEVGGWTLNDTGQREVRRWLRRFSLSEVLDAVDDADGYLKTDPVTSKPSQDSFERFFSMIPRIAAVNKKTVEKPYWKDIVFV